VNFEFIISTSDCLMCQEPNKGQCAAQKTGFLHWRKKNILIFTLSTTPLP
jgi:hypothetical protein